MGNVTVPWELPSPTSHFRNRSDQLSQLDEIVQTNPQGHTSRLVLVNGDEKVGKTNLVSYWALQFKQRFPDGQIYFDFDRFNDDGTIDLAETTQVLLNSIGAGDDFITDENGRVGQWQSETAKHRMLLVFDNLNEPGILRRLRPTSPDSTVVVISQVNAPGFIAEGAVQVEVPPFSVEHSVALLSDIYRQASHEPDAAHRLAELCGGRTDTVAAMAGHLKHTGLGIAELLHDLALGSGTPQPRAFAAMAQWRRFAGLSKPAQELFQRLQCHPKQSISDRLVNWLASPKTRDELVRANFLKEAPRGRWKLDEEADATGALDASRDILDWYLATARNADISVMGRDRLRVTEVDTRDGDRLNESEAMTWFKEEIGNLCALQAIADARGWDEAVVAIEESLWVPYINIGYAGKWELSSKRAIAAATRLKAPALIARMRTQRARLLLERGEFEAAEYELDQALELAREAEHIRVECSAWETLGQVHHRQSRHERSGDAFGTMLRLAENEPDLARTVALARRMIARTHRATGDHAAALEQLHSARETMEELDQARSLARIWHEIAQCHLKMHDAASALEALDEVDQYLQPLNLQRHQANSLELRGEALLAARDRAAAMQAWQAALDIHTNNHNGYGPDATKLREKLHATPPE